MRNTENAMTNALIATLHADGPAADRADTLDLYGRFIGDWDADVITHGPDGARHTGHAEIHFGWILEGRAIQDVWILPAREDRRPGAAVLPIAGNWYGTTLRVYDPALDGWRIFWIDPESNTYRQQVGRARGLDIVQEGSTESGNRSRWSFTKITPRSFHWLGEASTDDGRSWRLLVEVRARRVR